MGPDTGTIGSAAQQGAAPVAAQRCRIVARWRLAALGLPQAVRCGRWAAQVSTEPLGGEELHHVILLLNGASSSGKTSLARALQLRWPSPLLHLGTDTALQMLPQSYVGMKPSARDGIEFYDDTDDVGPVVRVRSGPVGKRLQDSFARAVRLLAESGHDLVLDLVLFDRNSVSSYVRALNGHPTYLIGVLCDLAVLEARELARGDRFQNLSRAQLNTVHEFREFYDLEVDTTARGPRELAEFIGDFVAAHPSAAGIARLHSRLVSQQSARRPTRPCS